MAAHSSPLLIDARQYTSNEVDRKVESDKMFDRLTMGPHVDPPVRHFFMHTQPSKLWYQNFINDARHFTHIHVTRKHDGYFIGLYVDGNGRVQWQTMGGFIMKFIEVELQPFVDMLQGMVDS